MKLRTLVIDDEPIALEKLRNYVGKVPFLELAAACRNGIEATSVMASEKIDVIFTDINMPDMSGMEFVGSLTKAPLVVFITAYADYAVESYRFSAVDYLLKPYGFADFQRAANKVLEQYELRFPQSSPLPSDSSSPSSAESPSGDAGNSLFVKVDYRYIRVELDRIRYIKGYGEYLQIFMKGNSTPLLTLSSFNAIKEKLSPDFIQVHRSYIVNMGAVESISKGRIIMDKATDIPIGDSYRTSLLYYLSNRSVGSGQKK